MPKAVRYDGYGGIDVLQVLDVDRPSPGPGEVLVKVRAAGINPGEAKIRDGALHHLFPATFPSGEGSDLAGVVEQLGDGVANLAVGDEVIGFTHSRASHAEYVLVESEHLTPKPPAVPWEVAGALFVAGTTAYAAVRAVAPRPGETVVIAGAGGGVGSLTVQLAVRTGARIVALASERHHEWLAAHGAIPVSYGDGVAQRIAVAAPDGVDGFVDLVGDGYVELALELGVAPDRIDTIVDMATAAERGVKAEGNAAGASAEVLSELAGLIAAGELELPIANVYPLSQVREAFTELEAGHVHGKIVLAP
jgi:NADPH:quinone reductase-like Zn-dependent oxidoreductase